MKLLGTGVILELSTSWRSNPLGGSINGDTSMAGWLIVNNPFQKKYDLGVPCFRKPTFSLLDGILWMHTASSTANTVEAMVMIIIDIVSWENGFMASISLR